MSQKRKISQGSPQFWSLNNWRNGVAINRGGGDCGKGRFGKGTESFALDFLTLRCLLDCQVISNRHLGKKSKVQAKIPHWKCKFAITRVQMSFKDMRLHEIIQAVNIKREDMKTTLKFRVGE